MLVIGMVIAEMDLKRIFTNRRAYMVCFGRLVLYPLITILVFCFSGILTLHEQASHILLVTLLAASAPCAANVTQIAQIYHKDAVYASSINVITVVFCMITMPIMTAIYFIF